MSVCPDIADASPEINSSTFGSANGAHFASGNGSSPGPDADFYPDDPPYARDVLWAFRNGLRPKSNGGWRTRCTSKSHGRDGEDTHPSLDVDVNERGTFLLCCRLGCTFEQIVAGAGLEMKALYRPEGQEPLEQTSFSGRSDEPLTTQDAQLRDRVYRGVLRRLVFAPCDRRQFEQERGLDAEECDMQGYRTMDVGQSRNVPQSLWEEFGDDLYRVPGFKKDARGNPVLHNNENYVGVVVPIYSCNGWVVALKTRRRGDADQKYCLWTTPGLAHDNLIHCPLLRERPWEGETLRVTEGELKAAAASRLTDTYTIGVPGASNWKGALPVIARLGPRRVLVSFDWADILKKPPVAQQALFLFEALAEKGYEVGGERWDPAHKGIDDALHNGAKIVELWGEEAEKVLRQYAPPAGAIPVIKIIPVVPPKLGEEAYYGFVGRFLRAVAPHTEATDAGVLAHLLAVAGTLVGGGPHVYAGDRQTARINVGVVGPTNAGRKGTSFVPVNQLMLRVDAAFWKARRVKGLSSGEGLIQCVADKRVWNDETKSEDVVPAEKRLFAIESEFSRVLSQTRREGNILSQVLRESYDSGDLGTLTVKPRFATDAHVSVVGHITPQELEEKLGQVEMVNGFGNRFLWFFVKSDKIMPKTRPIPEEVYRPFEPRMKQLLELGAKRQDRVVEMDGAAEAYWEKIYPGLREDRLGLAGAMLARGCSMVLRLALIYALLEEDLDNLKIGVKHLEAALAVWDYCVASAEMLFQSRTGNTLADKLLKLLASGSMKKSDFLKHLSEKQKEGLDAALALLESLNLARKKKVGHEGAGRPAEVWERV